MQRPLIKYYLDNMEPMDYDIPGEYELQIKEVSTDPATGEVVVMLRGVTVASAQEDFANALEHSDNFITVVENDDD
jgi:hypothetical protein